MRNFFFNSLSLTIVLRILTKQKTRARMSGITHLDDGTIFSSSTEEGTLLVCASSAYFHNPISYHLFLCSILLRAEGVFCASYVTSTRNATTSAARLFLYSSAEIPLRAKLEARKWNNCSPTPCTSIGTTLSNVQRRVEIAIDDKSSAWSGLTKHL